jgi:hypothetical protein
MAYLCHNFAMQVKRSMVKPTFAYHCLRMRKNAKFCY